MRYYVDVNAGEAGDGSWQTPFRSIQRAAELARPGDEILVAPGTYREYVDPAFGGTADSPIVYRAQVPGKAVISGAEVVDSWQHFEGDTWKAVLPNAMFGAFNPYREQVTGDW